MFQKRRKELGEEEKKEVKEKKKRKNRNSESEIVYKLLNYFLAFSSPFPLVCNPKVREKREERGERRKRERRDGTTGTEIVLSTITRLVVLSAEKTFIKEERERKREENKKYRRE